MISVRKPVRAESAAEWCQWLLGKIMGWQWIRMAEFGVGAITAREKFLLMAPFQLKAQCVDSAPPFLPM
jgi:hypothetical protein